MRYERAAFLLVMLILSMELTKKEDKNKSRIRYLKEKGSFKNYWSIGNVDYLNYRFQRKRGLSVIQTA